jgi:hypothetical protein
MLGRRIPAQCKTFFQKRGICQTRREVRMRAELRAISVALLGVILGSCAWAPTSQDRAHLISDMTDRAARDSAQCQSSGAPLGSQAYKDCRKLLESRMSIENNVPARR